MIGRFLFAAAIAGGVGYAYPLWNEHAATTCQAVENRFFSTVAPDWRESRPARVLEIALARTWLEPLSNGRIAASQAKRRYPALPPDIGCAVGYWTSLLDPGVRETVGRVVR